MEGLNLVASDVSGAIAFPSTSTLIQHLEFIILHLIDAFTRHIFKIIGITNPILALLVFTNIRHGLEREEERPKY